MKNISYAAVGFYWVTKGYLMMDLVVVAASFSLPADHASTEAWESG